MFLFFVAFQFFQSQIYVSEGTFIYSSDETISNEISESISHEENIIISDKVEIFIFGNATVIDNELSQNVDLVYVEKKVIKNDLIEVTSNKIAKQEKVIKNLHKKVVKTKSIEKRFNDFSGDGNKYFSDNFESRNISISSFNFKLKKNIEQYTFVYSFTSYFFVQTKLQELYSKSNNQSYYFSFSVRPPPVFL